MPVIKLEAQMNSHASPQLFAPFAYLTATHEGSLVPPATSSRVYCTVNIDGVTSSSGTPPSSGSSRRLWEVEFGTLDSSYADATDLVDGRQLRRVGSFGASYGSYTGFSGVSLSGKQIVEVHNNAVATFDELTLHAPVGYSATLRFDCEGAQKFIPIYHSVTAQHVAAHWIEKPPEYFISSATDVIEPIQKPVVVEMRSHNSSSNGTMQWARMTQDSSSVCTLRVYSASVSRTAKLLSPAVVPVISGRATWDRVAVDVSPCLNSCEEPLKFTIQCVRRADTNESRIPLIETNSVVRQLTASVSSSAPSNTLTGRLVLPIHVHVQMTDNGTQVPFTYLNEYSTRIRCSVNVTGTTASSSGVGYKNNPVWRPSPFRDFSPGKSVTKSGVSLTGGTGGVIVNGSGVATFDSLILHAAVDTTVELTFTCSNGRYLQPVVHTIVAQDISVDWTPSVCFGGTSCEGMAGTSQAACEATNCNAANPGCTG